MLYSGIKNDFKRFLEYQESIAEKEVKKKLTL